MKRALILLAALLLTLCCAAALAEEEPFVIDDKGTLTAYNGSGGFVDIPEGVKAIGAKAFYKNSSIWAVHIPEGVKSIGKWAFGYCDSLGDVTLPASLTSVGDYAFAGCDALNDVAVAEGSKTFISRSGVLINLQKGTLVCYPADKGSEEYVVPGLVSTIAPGAFYHCRNLRAVYLGPNVKSIGASAFSGGSLEQVYLTSALQDIGSSAFLNCRDLERVVFDGMKKDWEAIQIGKTNQPLTDARLLYLRSRDTANYINEECWLELWHTCALNGVYPRASGEAEVSGRVAVAVYEQAEYAAPLEHSFGDALLGYSFYGIPAEYLAADWTQADWLLLIYPAYTKVASYGSGVPGYRTDVKVMAVSLSKGRAYAPYTAASDEPPDTIWASDDAGWGEFLWEEAVRAIAADLTNPGDESLYRQAEDYLRQEKYYSAYTTFRQSHWADWRKRAAACQLTWPASGEVWRSPAFTGRNVTLTFEVHQSGDTAMLVRLYQNASPVSFLFIAGSSSVTVRIPAGTYTIKDGSGITWYGVKEAFGRAGSYETMLFDGGRDTVTLQGGGRYTITVNVTENGNVGKEEESFEGFSVD